VFHRIDCDGSRTPLSPFGTPRSPFQSYVAIVAVRQCLHIARGGVGFQEGLLFPPVSMFLNMVGLMLIITCAIMVLMLPAYLVVGFAILSTIPGNPTNMESFMWFAMILTLLLVMSPPAIWLWIRLWLSYYFLADQNVNCIDALVKAWRVSSGNFWQLFCASIAMMCPIYFWAIACCSLAFLINGNVAAMNIISPILFVAGTIPAALLLWFGGALAYLQLTGEPHYLERGGRIEIT